MAPGARTASRSHCGLNSRLGTDCAEVASITWAADSRQAIDLTVVPGSTGRALRNIDVSSASTEGSSWASERIDRADGTEVSNGT